MASHRAAVRYASALLGAASEQNSLDAIDRDLGQIEAVIRSSPQFGVFLRSPVVNKESKRKVFAALFPSLAKPTASFISLLTSKDREGLLPEIIEQFKRLRDAKMGIVRAKARSAVALGPDQRLQLERRLGEATGKKVSVEYATDPALIGGFTVQFGDTVLDASVRRQLELLSERLTQ
jgi:F-type H+-transporting ATPase subunit delta